MDQDRAVQANFTRILNFQVSVDVGDAGILGDGNGSVQASPAGMTPNPCTQNGDGVQHCSASYAEGSSVTLRATGSADFTNWTGPCASETSSVCTFTVTDAFSSVRARYNYDN